MTAPDRIFAGYHHTYGTQKVWDVKPIGNQNWQHVSEYIRADLVPQWMPIETAPKDGEWILGYFPSIGVAQMIWCNDAPGLIPHWMRFGKLTIVDPTHWQPLPNPPPAN